LSVRAADGERLRRAIRGEPLPLALVDLGALEANVERLVSPARARGKRIRVATKSVRCPALLERIASASRGVVVGAMTYAAGECAVLMKHGFDDFLLAYPTVQRTDLVQIADANRRGATARLIVDSAAHVEAAASTARRQDARIPVVIDVDASYRPVVGIHLGVRRSPLHDPAGVVSLARQIAASPDLRFDGIMMYEAQIAGLQDVGLAERAMKRLSRRDVVAQRASIVEALTREGLAPQVVNGGGTGSVDANAREAALTEIAAGSGFLDSHLFDGYRGLELAPASFFALQVARVPAPGLVTCHGGGWVASGPPGRDRLPIPVAPPGLSLLDLEGAGEVQTPLRVPRGTRLDVGDSVLFRHAKAGELAEHVNEYLLVEGERVVDRVKTYRGLGQCFLG